LLEQLRDRLDCAAALHLQMREGLERGDAEAIESATPLLETLLLEFKVLRDEYERLGGLVEPTEAQALCRAKAEFETTATRLARAAAVGGGLLERLVSLNRRLLDTLETSTGETYLASGQPRRESLGGLRLRGRA
jgi:hypothetical protein